MNSCSDRHIPIYKIKYKPTSPGDPLNEWLVCEKCFVKEDFFSLAQEIEFIASLRKFDEIRLNIDHLYALTNSVTRKIEKFFSL